MTLREYKCPALVLAPLVGVVVLTATSIAPWVTRLPLSRLGLWFGILATLSALIWLVVMWWAAHHLLFQLAGLFHWNKAVKWQAPGTPIRFALLYLTCDDFQADACASCISQEYPQNEFEVVICDDSQEAAYLEDVDRFQRAHPQIKLIRREARIGYKAGNINHALESLQMDAASWAVVVDADQLLPRDFLWKMARSISEQPIQVAFVQGRVEADHAIAANNATDQVVTARVPTPFQRVLGLEVQVFYERDLTYRQNFGFMPFLGHGGAIRYSAWKEVGGFPAIVSEDYAFAIVARENNLVGAFAEHVHSWESFPKDFGAFLIRLRKFAGGSAELFHQHLLPFVFSPSRTSSFTERLDVLMLLLWYGLMPLIVANVYISAYVCHTLWAEGISYLHPALPYVFVTMFSLSIPVMMSVAKNPLHSILAWFWAVGIYTASMPMAALAFVSHWRRKPQFERTPKGLEESHGFRRTGTVVVIAGAVAIYLSARWWSPFSPFLAGYGVAFLLFPGYHHLNRPTFVGKAMRGLFLFLPGVFYILALVAMWQWAKL